MLVLPPSSLPITLVSLIFSLALAPLIDARATPLPNSLSVPVLRRANTTRFKSLEELGSWAQNNKLRAEAKYGMNGQRAKRAAGTNLLTNLDGDSTYFGSIAVGTPPTAFYVILDTGSSDLWLASGINDRASRGIALYEPQSSSTFIDHGEVFSIQYGSGQARGTLGSDEVQFAGFQVNQTFGVVNETSSSLLTTPLSGLMGLAFQSIAASKATPFWQSLVETSGALNDPLFTFQLTRFTQEMSLQPGGTFTLGALNNSLFTGDIDFQSIPDGASGYWIQELTSLNVNGQAISLPTGSGAWAAIDTGTTGVGCPADILASIFAAVPGSQRGTGRLNGYYTFPCSTTVNVIVKWGTSSVSWPISPADFVLQKTDQNICLSAFFEVDSSGTTAPAFIFGDTFLKNVYSVFRASPAAVGFATLSSTALAMNGVDGPAPSATVGSVVPVSPTSTGSSGSPGSSSGAGHGTSVAPAAILASILLGASTVLALI